MKTIYLRDIANVGPVPKPKKNRFEWKSVYHALVGITAEYIQNVLRPRPGDPLYRDLEQFFVHSAETSEKWLARMGREHDSLSEILDALDFSKDEAGYSEFASTVSFSINEGSSEIKIGDLAIPYSQAFLRIREIDGMKIALLYSQSKEISYKAISGPVAFADYSDKAEAILEEPTGIQQNPEPIPFSPIDSEKFFELTDDLRDADPDQRAAISADIDKNLLVVAGAGSGKTRSIVGRMCYLHLVKGIPLRKMAALTFMRRARHPLIKSASEQISEAYRKLGIDRTPDEVNISTLDAFFRRLIDNHWEEMGFKRKPLFKFDTKKEVKLKILQQIILDNDYPAKKGVTDQSRSLLENQPLRDLYDKIEGCADGLVVNIPGIENILNSYIEYQMQSHEILEFYASALIVKRALESNPDMKDRIREDFRCILIDEYQDINRLQNEIFSYLYGPGIHFTLVGDDDQTIYTWRGSDVGIIRDVLMDEDVRKVYLTINYRNNPHIVEAGNSILDKMDARSKKGMKITPYRDEGPKIRICEVSSDYGELANEIRKMYDPSPEGKKICIMARDSECFEAIWGALQSFNIPSVITKRSSDSDLSPGYKIFKALASIFCGFNVKGSYDMLNELTGERYANSELKSFIKGGKAFTDSEEGCKVKVSDVVRLAEYFDIRCHHAVSFEDLVSNYCRAYAENLEMDPSEDRIVQDLCLRMFSDYVSANDWPYPQITKSVFETIFSKFERHYLTSNSIYGFRNDDSNAVVISTIHSSKGLEYDIVFVVSMDHEVFPKTRKINEEYDRYISDIADLEKSVKALARLRYNIDEDTFQSIIDECDPESSEICDPEDIEYFKEELIESKSDIIDLNANGVEAYQLSYDDYISPIIEMRKKRIRALQLEKRVVDERYYLCEDRYLSQDGDDISIRNELESINSERSEMESRISQAKTDMESFLESIRHIELMHGLCSIASQYFADINHLNHMEQLRADLEKEREEKIQEELRSFYVSISRARDLLYLCTTYGYQRSEFIGFISGEDREDYPLTTKAEDDMRGLVETYKASIAAEASRRNPDFAKIDEATSQMMGGLNDSLRSKCDTYILNCLRDNPEYKRLTGHSKDFLMTALRLDYLGKMVGTDFNNEVLLNLQRSGEELLRSHITNDAVRITADEAFCKALNSDLYYLIQASSKVGLTPDLDYLKRVFVLPDKFSNFRKNFKDMSVGLYAVMSGQWSDKMDKYRANWDVKELSIAPEKFIVHALDLCNIRNKTTHLTMDETWKSDQVPIAYRCLKALIIAFTS